MLRLDRINSTWLLLIKSDSRFSTMAYCSLLWLIYCWVTKLQQCYDERTIKAGQQLHFSKTSSYFNISNHLLSVSQFSSISRHFCQHTYSHTCSQREDFIQRRPEKRCVHVLSRTCPKLLAICTQLQQTPKIQCRLVAPSSKLFLVHHSQIMLGLLMAPSGCPLTPCKR